jgi:hypothetical protein
MKWEFRQLQKGEVEKHSHTAEFFNEEALPEAIVREFIQNSLDAKKSKKIKIRFAFHRIGYELFEEYIKDLNPHLSACNIKTRYYPEREILIIEDFGTTGLDGEITWSGQCPPQSSNFYDFWWSEGRSEKRGTKAGRWGVGKTTFFIASQIKTCWGYTIRHDKKEFIMGRASLIPHTMNEISYLDYGTFSSDSEPVSDSVFIDRFKTDFAVSRNKEPGFSLVIPMPKIVINYSDIVRYTIMHYFFPIMKDELVVEIIEKTGEKTVIDTNNIFTIACNETWKDTPWENQNIQDLLSFSKEVLELIQKDNLIKFDDTVGEELEIREDSFGDKLPDLISKLNSNKIIGLKMPLTIKKSDGKQVRSYFQLFIKKYKPEELVGSDEYYIRSGITLPKEKNLRIQNVRAILIADDDEISSFLGDCEEPAHTRWNERTSDFSDKYLNGIEALRFIKNSMRNIINFLNKEEQIMHKDLLQDIFYIIKIKEKTTKKRSGKPDIPPLTPSEKIFQVFPTQKGFKIKYIGEREKLPVTALVTIAYRVSRGNPFNNYVPLDFDLNNKKQFEIHNNNCIFSIVESNKFELIVKKKDMSFEINGFDENRDIIVDLRVKKK